MTEESLFLNWITRSGILFNPCYFLGLEQETLLERAPSPAMMNIMLGVMFAVFLVAVIITIAMIRRLKR